MHKQDFKLTLFVGDTDESLSIAAKQHSTTALLVDHSNYKSVVDFTLTEDLTIYTSLGDLPNDLQIFVDLCTLSDQIFYCPPDVWSDHSVIDEFDPTVSVQGLTEHLLLLISINTPVHGLNLLPTSKPIPLVDQRKTDDPQLWVAGCSISHGIGVLPEQRYGHLLSNKLNLKCSFLTRAGSAIDWASDQIIRSDIRSGDTVILGVTNVERLTYVDNKKLVAGVTLLSYDLYRDLDKVLPRHNLITENTFYQHLIAIERVINFCSKVGAQLLLFGILTNRSANMLRALSHKQNFFQFPYDINPGKKFEFKDIGSDEIHPGPLQHQLYADYILKHLPQAASR